MAQNRRANSRPQTGSGKREYRSTYVEGNTVRKAMPREKYRQAKRIEVEYTARRNREKELHMNLPYVLVLSAAAICMLVICIQYIGIQSSISARINNIEKLEGQLAELKEENDTLETRINTYVDLDYVYQVATEELGMVYANKDQVLLYDETEREYVRQYEDIPKY